MRHIPDQLKSRNLVPFKKRLGRYKIPGLTSEREILMDRVDADLSPEEQGFIRHYLGYADAFLRSTEDLAPEPLEEPVAQSGSVAQNGRIAENQFAQNPSVQKQRQEVTEQPSPAKADPSSNAA